ncbi:MAG: general secretion pathway protein GspK [Candidatus Rokubacteria bacterium]|nr:general secretion pathway protein GspK [Candidatus Rokubacteria bacterium]
MPRGPRAQGGFALVIVLFVLLLLSMIGGAFALAVRTEALAVRNGGEDLAGYALALAGVHQALAEVLGEWEVNFLDPSGAVRFARKDGSPLPSLAESARVMAGEVGYRILDEEGKINVNRADQKLLTALLRVVELPPGTNIDEVADAILDWVDSDRLRRLNGAEDDYYLALRIPYLPKNGPMGAIEELLLVKGITPELYALLSQVLTVYGAGRVNVNTAPPAVLRAVFPNDALSLTSQRRAKPIVTARAPGIVRSSTFTIIAAGRGPTSRAPRFVKAVVTRLADGKAGEGGTQRYIIRAWDDDYPAWAGRASSG